MIGVDEIACRFPPGDVVMVSELLGQYTGPEPTRVKRAILGLAQGDMFRLRHYLDAAITDYRDVLYWSEYADLVPGKPEGD